MKANKATVEYTTTMGMTARKPVIVEAETLDELRDLAACLVNGDTYTYTINYEKGNLKNHFETHAFFCGGKNCKCVFKEENPQKYRD